MRSSGLPRVEPAILCDECGTLGTVGRVYRRNANDEIVDQHRFCSACWTRESERIIIRWEEEHEARSRAGDADITSNSSIHAESATWDNAVFLVTGIEGALQDDDPQQEPISREALAKFADEIAAGASEMVGPIPDNVARFIERCRTNAVQQTFDVTGQEQ